MIIEYEEKWLEMIDDSVESASDDELFAGGYLRGHISLSAAACESEGELELDALIQCIEESLDQAKSELTPTDRVIVHDLWIKLKNHSLKMNAKD